MALVQGVVEGSYRKTSARINRMRHQAEATSARRLCDTAEMEGQRILSYLDHRADQILEKEGFRQDESPPEVLVHLSGQKAGTLPEAQFQEALEACDLSAELKAEMAQNPVPYEAPDTEVYVTLDDVGVKQQKPHRLSTSKNRPQSPKAKKQHTYTTTAHVENEDFSYVLAGKGIVCVLRLLLALLLNNCLWCHGLIFLTDGQKSLQEAILRAFSWWKNTRLILDWYHLDKRCKEGLSLILNGRDTRNAVLEKLRPLLWHGLTDSAIQLLEKLNSEQVKNEAAQQHLIAYLKRGQPYIPCYAVRKQLGLRNGSSIGEKLNDLLVADRQKHNGMSWSVQGSVALAALTALIRNGEHLAWFRKKTLDFKLKLAA